jgi:diguanylate cyclase (GGDEF)-like protein
MNVLVVEDSRSAATLIVRKLEKAGYKPVWAMSYRAAKEILDTASEQFAASLLDISLPDAPNGEIVDLMVSRGIPAIVFTASFSDEMQDTIWSRKIVDYVVKEGAYNIEYVISLIRRLELNRSIKVLVVDDSSVSRKIVRDFLEVHRYQVLEASDGKEALEILDAERGIKMIITDFSMPNMDGFELTGQVRCKYSKEELAIIGISAHGNPKMSARFIKNGANDFLDKPFSGDQFYCRITQNVEMLEQFETIRNASRKDFLTGLYNRRFFFESGEKMFAMCQRQNLAPVVAMIDIDHFKKINDTHGHDAGDAVLKTIAGIINARFRESDIVARMGGEEFCVLAPDMRDGNAARVFDSVRRLVDAMEVDVSGQKVKVTISIGICAAPCATLEDMLKEADHKLYDAKNKGRNRVEI